MGLVMTAQDTQTLHDLVLYNAHKDPEYAFLKDRMIRARKFVLTDAMSAFMADLSYAAFWSIPRDDIEEGRRIAHSIVNGARRNARLPFDVTWIEFSTEHRLRRWGEEYASKPLPSTGEDPQHGWESPSQFVRLTGRGGRMGWLLEQESPSIVRVTMITTYPKNPDGIVVSPAVYKYSTSDDVMPSRLGTIQRELGVDPYDWRNAEFQRELLDLMEVQTHGVHGGGTDHVGIYPSETYELYSQDLNNVEVFLMEAKSELRYVWTLLSTINDVPAGFEVSPTRSRGFMSRGKRRNYLSHTVVDITVPGKKAARKLARRVVMLARNRRHEVRGHWKRVGIEKIRKWVMSYLRGDATLGWVNRTYSVKRKEEAS